jgi:hypothetical protein
MYPMIKQVPIQGGCTGIANLRSLPHSRAAVKMWVLDQNPSGKAGCRVCFTWVQEFLLRHHSAMGLICT